MPNCVGRDPFKPASPKYSPPAPGWAEQRLSHFGLRGTDSPGRTPALPLSSQQTSRKSWFWGGLWEAKGPQSMMAPSAWESTCKPTTERAREWKRGQGRRGIGRNTYCKTAAAWPHVARAVSAPSAGTGTDPWFEGLPGPGATWDATLPAGQTRGSPGPSPGPLGGYGGRLLRPSCPSVAMPCFMHEGDSA